MDFRGVFSNGVIRPIEPVQLPNGTEVDCHPVNGSASNSRPNDFWRGSSLQELATEQGVAPISNVADLRGDWPAEESLDDLIDAVRKGRR